MRRSKYTQDEYDYLKENGLAQTVRYIKSNYRERIKDLKELQERDITRAKELSKRVFNKK